MQKLPIFVIQLIQNYGSMKDQFRFQSTSKKLKTLYITTLSGSKLNDIIILKHTSYLHTIYASGNPNITDLSVKELKNLHTLYTDGNSGITDLSVKELKKLHTLYT